MHFPRTSNDSASPYLAFVLTLAVTAAAAAAGSAAQNEPPELDLFAALQTGELSARFIPKSAAAGTLLLTNNSDRPLAIQLPAAFAGVPVLAQIGGPGPNIFGNGQNGANNANNGRAANQSVGASFPGGGPGGPGIFNIEPGRPRKLKVVSVCLDFGHPDPSPRIPYEIVPLAHRTTDPQLAALLSSLAHGQLDQPTAQAAAWHLSNGLKWSDLAAKSRVMHIGGKPEPLFTRAQLDRARQFVQRADGLDAESPAISSTGGE